MNFCLAIAVDIWFSRNLEKLSEKCEDAPIFFHLRENCLEITLDEES